MSVTQSQSSTKPLPPEQAVADAVEGLEAKIRELREALAKVTDADDTKLTRALYSTDASNYRIVPQVVVFPRTEDEVVEVLRIARERGVPITSRGAGTSCAGNAVGAGVVIDFSRHLNQVLEIDPDTQTAWIQPGVVQTDLQAAAKPYGLWFGPDPSTKNRATLGGMIGNNACGPHALAYGRTADNVVELDVVDGQGNRFTAGSGEENARQIPHLTELVGQNLALIRTQFGRFIRQVSGYSLEHLLPENGWDLAKALVGTEGTCVTVLKARVKLAPLPKTPILVVLSFPDMPQAADAVPQMLPLKPLAIEGIDAGLVDVVRRHHGSVPELPSGEGWLFCEVSGETQEEAIGAAHALIEASGCMDSRVVTDAAEATALWRIRADGVGLAGRTPISREQAWPGWEDAAVPPESLGDYLRAFEALMKKHDVEGLAYGHFGDGCIHSRLNVRLETPEEIELFRAFMEEAAQLVASFGGSLSGEHGDGRARSELLKYMYPLEVLELFGQFKALFDPQNALNPGVLVEPDPIDAHLRRPFARPSPRVGFAFAEDAGDFTKAVHRCTGIGKCRAANRGAGGFMCPSYQATKDEKDVTRGRARILQEATRGNLVGGFSDPVLLDALDLCLSCKACGRDCPAGVDMATYKAEATYRHYQGKLRPINHYVLGWLPRWGRLVTAIPGTAGLVNRTMGVDWMRRLAFRLARIDPRRQMTAFATERFTNWFNRQGRGKGSAGTAGAAGTRELAGGSTGKATDRGAGQAAATSSAFSGKPTLVKPLDVVVWADSFTEYLDPRGAQAMVELLQEAGYRVRIPSTRACCGLTWISTGQLDGAKKRLRQLLDVLGPAAEKGVPIIGVEPSCTSVLRSDLVELVGDDPRAAKVAEMTMTLAELLTDPKWGPGEGWKPSQSLVGTTVIAQPHCHQYSVIGYQADVQLVRRMGAEVVQLAGCCGLAGNFGMEQGHYDVSVKVAESSLLPALRSAPEGAVFLADGYSCRTQAEQLADYPAVTLAELLNRCH